MVSTHLTYSHPSQSTSAHLLSTHIISQPTSFPSAHTRTPKGFFAKNCQTAGSQCILDAWELADPLNIGGDARVLYDKGTDRWYLSAFANRRNASNANLINLGRIFLAVSTTDNPTKPWRVLEMPAWPYPNNR